MSSGASGSSNSGGSRQSRMYQVAAPREVLLSELTHAMEVWLHRDNFRTQVLMTGTGSTLVQIEKQGRWRKFLGMSTALNVVLTYHDENTKQVEGGLLHIEIGEGRWLDKVAGGAIGFLLLWPFLITTTIGSVEQCRMPKRVFNFIERFLNTQPSQRNPETAALVPTIAQTPPSAPPAPGGLPTAQAFYVPNNSSSSMTAAAASTTGSETDSVIENLERLTSLREKGVLTADEFQSQKDRILKESMNN